MDKRCPKCGLSNPESAERCDCGYDFTTNRIEQSFLTAQQQALTPAKPENLATDIPPFANLPARLRYIYLPFLLIAIAFDLAYTLFDRFAVETSLISLDDQVVGIWLPLALPWIAILVWLRPPVGLFKLWNSNARAFVLFTAALAIGVPVMVMHAYLATATGKLTHVPDASQISTAADTKYFSADRLCLEKGKGSVSTEVNVAGRNNETLALSIYIVAPLCGANLIPKGARTVWIGWNYAKGISNHLSNEEKEASFRQFYDESLAAFNEEDATAYTYLEQPHPSAQRKGLLAALAKSEWRQPDQPVVLLIPHRDIFEQRNGDKLAWSVRAFGVGASLWLFIILLPPLDRAGLDQLKSGQPRSERPWREGAAGLLIPTPAQYALPLLIDINILVFVVMVFAGLGLVSFGRTDLLAWGANFRPALHGMGWLRLISSQFVHGGIMHLINNLYALLVAGSLLFPILGNRGLIAAYLLTGLGGSIASVIIHPATVSVGASGAIFGLFGILLVLILIKDKRVADKAAVILKMVLIFGGLNLFIGFVSAGTDNAAHIGGILAGGVFGLVFHLTGASKPINSADDQ